VCVDFEQPQLLLQLAQLPALTHLALQYDWQSNRALAAATASAWSMLPQLRELEIAHSAIGSQSHWDAIIAGAAAAAAAAAAGLIKLTLADRMMSDELGDDFSLEHDNGIDERGREVAACARLAKLTCLQDLTVGGSGGYYKLNLLHGDALALTARTRLTSLVLFCAEHGVGTAVATALARNLQQLQRLDLGNCCLELDIAEGLACLEAIGRLTQLTWLKLTGNGLTQHGFMQLTGLSRLEQAGNHGWACVV
jgi:hypothetical protein